MKVPGRSDYGLVNKYFSRESLKDALLVYIQDCRIEDTQLVMYNLKN